MNILLQVSFCQLFYFTYHNLGSFPFFTLFKSFNVNYLVIFEFIVDFDVYYIVRTEVPMSDYCITCNIIILNGNIYTYIPTTALFNILYDIPLSRNVLQRR